MSMTAIPSRKSFVQAGELDPDDARPNEANTAKINPYTGSTASTE